MYLNNFKTQKKSETSDEIILPRMFEFSGVIHLLFNKLLLCEIDDEYAFFLFCTFCLLLVRCDHCLTGFPVNHAMNADQSYLFR